MAKQAGMGDAFFVDEFDISGDVGSVNLAAPMTVQDVTSLPSYGNERIGLLHDGTMTFTSFWNPTKAGTLDSEHDVLKTRPVTDRQLTYCRSTVLGAPAASLRSLQTNYDGTRNQDGSLTFSVAAVGDGYGLEWGQQLTAGKRTEATAGNAPSVDLGALPVSFSFGWAMYLHVFAFTGTSITVKVQDSADNATFADITGATFVAATAKGVQRVMSASPTATVRRYLRVVSAGTFTNAVYAVNFVRYESIGAPR